MAFSIAPGIWPVMITPWTDDNKPDFKAIAQLCDWYVERGCAGIFAVCQSSEMAYLTEQEKLDIARATVDAVGGRIQVVASGHTADDNDPEFFILCCHRFLPLISPASCRRQQGSSSRWHRKLPRSR